MRKNKRKIYSTAIAAAVIVIVMILAACTTTADSVQATFWGLVPPIIAIGLALLTKEVYSSLFIGILAGALLYTGFNVEDTVNHVFSGGIVTVLSDTGNLGIQGIAQACLCQGQGAFQAFCQETLLRGQVH